MADDFSNPGTASVIQELKDWLNSSLCGCVVSKSEIVDTSDKTKFENGQEHVKLSISLDATILDRMWANGKIFQWLLHSFKPDFIPCPSTNSDVDEADLPKLQLAFKLAQDELGVQNLLLSEDFAFTAVKKPESLVLLTYLEQLKHALRNTEPACLASRSQLSFTWPYNGEDESVYLRSLTESPKCNDCQETVLILDRVLLAPNSSNSTLDVRHRRCFRCERCRKLLRIGLYRPMKSGVGFECLEHEKEDLASRLTSAPENKQKDETRKELQEKLYPELPKAEAESLLYPHLASPEEKATDTSGDSGVSSSPTAQVTSTPKTDDQLTPPPVASRSRSSERDVPVPAPRKSIHGRDADEATTPVIVTTEKINSTSPSAVSPAEKPVRPERPAFPPKPKDPPVQLRHYPEELNPFGDPDPITNRHSLPPATTAEKAKTDRRSIAVGIAETSSSSVKTSKDEEKTSKSSSDYNRTLNPFCSDSESDEDDKTDGNDDSSLSSTNPFNESEDESDERRAPVDKSTEESVKKPPPPRPPPPSKPVPTPVSSTPKQKKRPAPPPPPPESRDSPGGPPPRPTSPKKQHRKKRPAPPRPLPLKRQIRTESCLSPNELALAFEENDKQLLDIETAAGTFETDIRGRANDDGLAKFSDSDIREWIDFIHRKFDLIRKETELVYMCRERQLDELHAEIEYQLRCVIEKPESEKSTEDTDREASLLQRLLDVIEEKSKLVDNQDEMRAQTGTLPRNSIILDDSSLSGGAASRGSTLDKSIRSVKTAEEKQEKKKKKIKLRLKKLKQKIANSPLLHHNS